MNYTSILQVLGESGCPFCRFMKDVQAAALADAGENTDPSSVQFPHMGICSHAARSLRSTTLLDSLENAPLIPESLRAISVRCCGTKRIFVFENLSAASRTSS